MDYINVVRVLQAREHVMAVAWGQETIFATGFERQCSRSELDGIYNHLLARLFKLLGLRALIIGFLNKSFIEANGPGD